MIGISKLKTMATSASPDILIGVGIAAGIIATTLACKATLHVEEELDKTKEQIEDIKTSFAEEPANDEKFIRKNISHAYFCGTARIVRLYIPAIFVGAVSISCILYGHNIMAKRSIRLAAAYEVLDNAYRRYRERVVAAVGEEAEKKIRYDYDTKDIEYIHVDEEFNEKKKTKKNAKIVNDTSCSPYARFFDEGCINWTKSPEKNLYFLRIMQAEANDLLHSRGHIFLNEVYDMLGIPRTEDGQLVGWMRGGNDVDFGIYNMFREANRDFVNGYEPVVLLDFNVDGLIYNKL